MNNQDILFAGLMGSKALETLGRLEIVQNELGKHVLPAIPFLPFQNMYLNKQDTPLAEEHQFFPVSFSFGNSETRWTFPYEPMVSVSGGNNIVQRNVSKQIKEIGGSLQTGTIKERWSQKDYEITITGVLFGDLMKGKPEDCYPTALMTKLMQYLTKSKEITIYCELLNVLGILKIVITDFSFPFTKGENVQSYEIKALSDFNYDLLLEPINKEIL